MKTKKMVLLGLAALVINLAPLSTEASFKDEVLNFPVQETTETTDVNLGGEANMGATETNLFDSSTPAAETETTSSGTTTSTTTTTPTTTSTVACSDGMDNDGDGKIDFPADPDCAYKMDPSEAAVITTPVTNPVVVESAEETLKPAADEVVVAVKETQTGNTKSGPTENMLIAGLMSLAAIYHMRKKNLAKEANFEK